jgi:hypothetical protein
LYIQGFLIVIGEAMTQWSLHRPLPKRMRRYLGSMALSGQSVHIELAQTGRYWVFATVQIDWDRTCLDRAAGDQVFDVQ